MKILGLDLSLTGTGVVLLDGDKVAVELLIKSKPTEKKRPIDEIERLVLIREKIISVIKENKPDLVSIENLAFGVRNATSLTQLSYLNYAIRAYLWENKIKFILIAPTSLKKFITRSGKAQKEEMMFEVFNKYHLAFTDSNIVDAFSLAVVGRTLLDGKITEKHEMEVLGLLKKQSDD